MLTITAKNDIDLWKQAFFAVEELDEHHGDPKNYKETSAALILQGFNQPHGIELRTDGFVSVSDYDTYLPEGNKSVAIEISHYNELLVANGKLEQLQYLLASDPYTKKAVLNVWSPNLDVAGSTVPCLVYLWARRINNTLDVNFHMRANDAYRLLLIDIHIGVAIHQYLASQLGLEIGEYRHLVDSLHLYSRDREAIQDFKQKLAIITAQGA
ncbi:MAG: thymidylate synthase [Myxococcaceae bacterium]